MPPPPLSLSCERPAAKGACRRIRRALRSSSLVASLVARRRVRACSSLRSALVGTSFATAACRPAVALSGRLRPPPACGPRLNPPASMPPALSPLPPGFSLRSCARLSLAPRSSLLPRSSVLAPYGCACTPLAASVGGGGRLNASTPPLRQPLPPAARRRPFPERCRPTAASLRSRRQSAAPAASAGRVAAAGGKGGAAP